VVVVGVVAVVVGRVANGPGWPLEPVVVLVLGLATVLAVAHEYYDLLLLAWPFAAAMRWPVERLTSAIGAAGDNVPDGPETSDDRRPGAPPPAAGAGPRWGAVLALTTLPALVVSVIPAQATTKLLGLGSGTAIISTLTTACLLVALVGAVAVVALEHRRSSLVTIDEVA
jgi:hypothetical protein